MIDLCQYLSLGLAQNLAVDVTTTMGLTPLFLVVVLPNIGQMGVFSIARGLMRCLSLDVES